MATRCTAAHPLLALVLGAALLAGCGGGGGGGSGPSPGGPVPTNPPPATSSQPASLTVFFPALKSSSSTPAYAPSSSSSLSVSINGVPSGVYDVSSTSTSCASVSGGRTCTFTVAAPVGSDTFALIIWDKPGGTGNQLATGSATRTIAVGTANALTIPLNGIVAKITLTLATTAPPQGTATSIPMTVTALDADNNVISTCSSCPAADNQFSNPITLSDSNTTDAPTIVNGTAGSVVGATTDIVTVAYDGSSLSTPVQFFASASGVLTSNVTGATLWPYGKLVLSASTVAFTSISGSQSVQASQAGYTGSLTLSTSSCTGIATITSSGTNPYSITVTPIKAGTCSVTVSGGFSQSATLAITVTSTVITIQ